MKRGLIYATLLTAILTARLGKITYNHHTETWYNLRMDKITERAKGFGIEGNYWEREDGCKMYGPFIILAADWDLHPYGTVLETSRGYGMVLDTHTADDRTTVDIATTW